jgi:hypothetical protein
LFSSSYVLFWFILSVLVQIISKPIVCKQFMFHGSILHLELPTEVKYKSKSRLNGSLSVVFKVSFQIKLVTNYFKEPNSVPISPSPSLHSIRSEMQLSAKTQ